MISFTINFFPKSSVIVVISSWSILIRGLVASLISHGLVAGFLATEYTKEGKCEVNKGCTVHVYSVY